MADLKSSQVPAADPSTICLVVSAWRQGQKQQLSQVVRIGGYPWRLQLWKAEEKRFDLYVQCEKWAEAALWQCTATITTKTVPTWDAVAQDYTFCSWDKDSYEHLVESGFGRFPTGKKIVVTIKTRDDGERWRLPPPKLGEFDARDGILVIGEEQNKMHVNKESLAAESPFFSTLFFGEFKETNMAEVRIEEVEYKEFVNIMKIIYGFDGAQLNDDNVLRVLELADKFELKIVEDKAVSFLLSDASSLSIHEKLLISEQYKIPFMTEIILTQYTDADLKEVGESDEFEELSPETVRVICRKCCKLIP